ncbi:Cyclin PHO80-like protein [Abortiporus biennis]
MVHVAARPQVHPLSQVYTSFHSPAMLEFLSVKMTGTLVDYIVECIRDTVQTALGCAAPVHPQFLYNLERNNLAKFMTRIIYKANIQVPTLLVALVYISRSKHYLHMIADKWANERVFLGALIVAYKYTNDVTFKNYQWAVSTGVFGVRDIGRIEREFLDVLDYQLAFTEEDILSHHEAIMALCRPSFPPLPPLPTKPPVETPVQPLKPILEVSCWSDDSSDEEEESSFPETPLSDGGDIEYNPKKYPMSPAPYRKHSKYHPLSTLYAFPTFTSSSNTNSPSRSLRLDRFC